MKRLHRSVVRAHEFPPIGFLPSSHTSEGRRTIPLLTNPWNERQFALPLSMSQVAGMLSGCPDLRGGVRASGAMERW